MVELRLISPRQHPLKPLVQAAIQNVMRLLEAGIRRAKQKLFEFEDRHQLSSPDFIERFERGDLEESLEFAE
jgi:hypothetical protein